MKSVRIALEIDFHKTLSYYKNLPLIGEEERCECIYCKNYALATAYFPKSVKTLLSNMGVNPKKDAEVSHFYEAKNSKHMYVADYRVFGKVLKKPNQNIIDIYHKNDEDYFNLGFENIHVLENDEIVMNFYIDAFLPWLLEVNPE
ncbi:hypothetical protein [Aquibacillus albus]|uniref:Uncharacterized protein n=1 Tax=Aquibacillus albus TaxID=1168171 RepID=A0ABS2N391_9BACI|nr:hypothetical protein [Aquibacillus albus]MBM7572385.1 hypothetical protein [Aquibacillus albus]